MTTTELVRGRQAAPSRLVVFAKYWEPGAVKTRLAAEIGEVAAAQLSRQFLALSLSRLQQVGGERMVYFAPAERRGEFASLAGHHWQLSPQSDGDLGARLAECFRESFSCGCQRVVVVGSDSPTLPVERVKEAFALLNTQRAVLGPAEDGGYYLVGLSPPPVDLFQDIPWGSDGVWPATLARLAAAGLREEEGYAILDSWYDVDMLPHLRRLRDELASAEQASSAARELRALATEVLDGKGRDSS